MLTTGKSILDVCAFAVAAASLVVAGTTYLRDARKLRIHFVFTYQTRQAGSDKGTRFVTGDRVITSLDSSLRITHVEIDGKPFANDRHGDCRLDIVCANAGRRPLALRRWGLVGIGGERAELPGNWVPINPAPTLSESATYLISITDCEIFNPSWVIHGKSTIAIEDTHGKQWQLPLVHRLMLQDILKQYYADLALNVDVENSAIAYTFQPKESLFEPELEARANLPPSRD